MLSWLVEFSVQEDHLHSSSTLWQPFSTGHYISVKWYILPPLVFLIFAASYLLYKYYTLGLEIMKFTSRDILFCSLVGSTALWPLYNVELVCAGLLLLAATKPLTKIPEADQYIYQLLLATISILVSVYFIIYFPVWAYLSCLATLTILLPRKLTWTLMFLGGAVLLYNCGASAIWEFSVKFKQSVPVGLLTQLPLLAWLLL